MRLVIMIQKITLFPVLLALPLAACSKSNPVDPADIDQMEDTVVENGVDNMTLSQPAYDVPTDPNIVTPMGLGTIGIGKAPAVAGAGVLKEDDVQLSDSCRMLKSDNYPRVYVISDGSSVRRITVMDRSKVKTAKGIGVGSSEEDVRKAYADLREEKHQYVEPPAKNLYYEPEGGNGPGLRFEIDSDGKVNLIHAGLEPELSYSEGCA